MYSHDAGARKMLDEDRNGNWSWQLTSEEKEELAKYASYGSYDEYLANVHESVERN